jgi:LysM repeat protein
MRKFILLFSLTVWLSACSSTSPTLPSPSLTLKGELIPFSSPTPSVTPSPLPLVATVSFTPIPTATPFTHIIAKDDTMLGIALRYGVTLEDLQAANPGVDPGFLVIGNSLIIPINGQLPNEITQPTPMPVTWNAPICYPSEDGGLWCFISVINDQPTALENLTGWINIYDIKGELLSGRTAVAPLNRVQVGSTMPLVAYFPPPLDDNLIPQGQLLSVIAVEDESNRYLNASVQKVSIEITNDGLVATVGGQVEIPQGSIPSSVWLALIAYDDVGKIVGMRKFDFGAPCGRPLTPTASRTPQLTSDSALPTSTITPSATVSPSVVCIPFNLELYSLGPAIQKVDVLVEARP